MARPSRTARGIAAARAVGLAGLHDPLALRFLPPAQRRIVARLRRTVEQGPAGEVTVNTLTAGLAGHAALRMHAIDHAVIDAATSGCHQVVVLGAGFDTRAWRLDALVNTRVIELDLRDTQAVKQRCLDGVPALAQSVTLRPADLSRDDLADVLATTGHVPAEPTMWIWEAVAPYLPHPAVDQTVTAVARLSATRSRLAMTVAHPDLIGSGAVARRLSPAARGLFAGIGEPLRSTHDDDAIIDLLTAHGFRDVTVSGSDQWAAAAGHGRVLDPFAAERLVQAGR
jgi:methyltransferase (TIGR00027 family)